MVYSPTGRSDLILILGCMTSNFLYLSLSTLYSSSLWRTNTVVFAKFIKPSLSIKPPLKVFEINKLRGALYRIYGIMVGLSACSSQGVCRLFFFFSMKTRTFVNPPCWLPISLGSKACIFIVSLRIVCCMLLRLNSWNSTPLELERKIQPVYKSQLLFPHGT